ncbi:MAG: hypothetical protein AVDCRST_MAG33-2712, partial [uncultured Thermomicrobiales bacterium]
DRPRARPAVHYQPDRPAAGRDARGDRRLPPDRGARRDL